MIMNDSELLRVLKALAHPKRFRMVQEIAAAGELSCGEIAEKFPVAQPTISHHLKILTDAGVLDVRREGQHGICSVNRAVVARAVAQLPSRLMPVRSLRRRRRPVGQRPRRSVVRGQR
jgi:ArsR family transcriptional regulator, arsenate/arsenite/antimonite-responsive transcriptional repressor